MKTLTNDFVCFSHLRWNFVFQRPQHLMSRFARNSRVYFLEEPAFEGDEIRLNSVKCPMTGVRVVTPVLPQHTNREAIPAILRQLVRSLFEKEQIRDFVAWYYTPMALKFSDDLRPAATIYDCMDELSAFAHAPADMLENEKRLFNKADLIFTGGQSLFEVKSSRHDEVHLFPSSVDVAHFSRARQANDDPADQKTIPHPRIGYAGVIDERMDLELIRYLADAEPEWQIVLLGPVVKINPNDLPKRRNIHALGMKNYQDLPKYFSGWDVALMPFAQNEATRFISPTKTPEYLAAGLPVVSTPIRDVERPYGASGLVRIGRDHEQFRLNVKAQLSEGRPAGWRSQVDAFLRTLSWDKTWSGMENLIARELGRSTQISASRAAQTAMVEAEASVARV